MEIKKTVDMKGGILVGHDGSRFSDHAVSWALKLAVRLSYDVTVVRAWVLTTAPRPETWSPGYVPPLADFADATRKALEADVAPLLRDFPTVNVSCQAVHGSPAQRLLETSVHADLLVVGARGRGGFRGLTLGSVSEKLVRHATSTVVVVREPSNDPAPAAEIEYDAGMGMGDRP